MVMVMRFLHLNRLLNVAKLFDVARNGDGSFMLESIFFFSFFPQLHEQWMIDVKKWDHKPLLHFFLTNHHSQIPFWNILILFMVVMKIEAWNVQMKTQAVVVMINTNPHK
ncbi:SAUR auxin-responsive protein family [Trifolium repens]|nr:SAUR auxin-responsive protein family [Trifolium repens]